MLHNNQDLHQQATDFQVLNKFYLYTINHREQPSLTTFDKLLMICQESLEEINHLKAISEERLKLLNNPIYKKNLDKIKA